MASRGAQSPEPADHICRLVPPRPQAWSPRGTTTCCWGWQSSSSPSTHGWRGCPPETAGLLAVWRARWGDPAAALGPARALVLAGLCSGSWFGKCGSAGRAHSRSSFIVHFCLRSFFCMCAGHRRPTVVFYPLVAARPRMEVKECHPSVSLVNAKMAAVSKMLQEAECRGSRPASCESGPATQPPRLSPRGAPHLPKFMAVVGGVRSGGPAGCCSAPSLQPARGV